MPSSLLQNRFENLNPFIDENEEESKFEAIGEEQAVKSETIHEEQEGEAWVEVCCKATKKLIRRKTVNWKSLPRDIAVMIFAKLEVVEMLASVPMVCPLWKNISKLPGSIRRLDLSNYRGDPYVVKILKFVTKVVDRSCGELVEFSANRFVSDDIVDYVVANTKSLRSIQFSCWSFISGEGLVNAIRKAPFLEELELFGGDCNKEMVEEIVRSCPRLKCVRINSKGNEIDDARLNEGLEIILDGCPNLECLDLERCFGVGLNGDLLKKYEERIRSLRLPKHVHDDYEFDDEFKDRYYFYRGVSPYYYDYLCSGDGGGGDDDDDYISTAFLPPKATAYYI